LEQEREEGLDLGKETVAEAAIVDEDFVLDRLKLLEEWL
jgi:hypothetical protein